MTQIIAEMNEKGGTGKTTVTTTLAAGLAIQGYRVLLIDADTQAHSTFLFRCRPDAGLYRLLKEDVPWQNILQVADKAVYAVADQDCHGQVVICPSSAENKDAGGHRAEQEAPAEGDPRLQHHDGLRQGTLWQRAGRPVLPLEERSMGRVQASR